MQSFVHSQQEPGAATSLSTPLKKYSYIDVLRGIAILGVIAVHSSEQNIEGVSKLFSGIFKYGQLGVQLFFVASAITLCLSMSGRNEGSSYNFYIRRLFRIAPLYYLGIALYLGWGTLKAYMATGQFSVPPQYSILGVLTNVFFVHGFYPPANNNIVPGGWSIATEMTFYVLFPYLYWIQSRTSNRLFILFSLSAIGACAVITFVIYWLWHGSPSYIPGFIYFSIFNQLGVFLIGMYAYRLLHSPMFGMKSILLALALTLASYLLLNQVVEFKFNRLLFPLLSAVSFLILAVRLSNCHLNNYFWNALKKIGQASFSMYIFHFLFLDLIAYCFRNSVFLYVKTPEVQVIILFFVASFVTYMAARISYEHLEKDGIDFGKRFLRKKVN